MERGHCRKAKTKERVRIELKVERAKNLTQKHVECGGYGGGLKWTILSLIRRKSDDNIFFRNVRISCHCAE